MATGQVGAWVEQIKDQMGRGYELDDAIERVKSRLGPLLEIDEVHLEHIASARQIIIERLNRPIEFLYSDVLLGEKHENWYFGPEEDDLHWPPLRDYLINEKNWDEKTAVRSIDQSSTEVVSLLANPARLSSDSRGLVLGYIQSGKTANMTGVIAKAVDRGYRFIILLSGLTNALRKQTQARIIQDLTDRNEYEWEQVTGIENHQDFTAPPGGKFAPLADNLCRLAVIKKNVTPLRHIISTLSSSRNYLSQTPVLVIDDECDQASVNASGSEFETSAINGLVRDLLKLLPRVTYIGYTATPFANVLINPAHIGGDVPEDLYPRDFIMSLPYPEGYFGPVQIFGREPIDADREVQDEEGMDVIRHIPEDEAPFLRPANFKEKQSFEAQITPSLEDAMLYFLAATAAREVRGQGEQHCSMLVHTTIYVVAHDRIAEAIEAWKVRIGGKLKTNDSDLLEQIERLWNKEMAAVDSSYFGLEPVTFGEILPLLRTVLVDIEVIIENGASENRLDYSDDGPTRRYIVVGGSVLARGLTIEGLTVSYFLRTSTQYDTLLQMGRWFGYRFGYQDLPRVWMQIELDVAFRNLAAVEAEIRADISEYKKRGLTPLELAVRIREIPGMAVTAASKMLAAQTCNISYSGRHVQTTRFRNKSRGWLDKNWQAAGDLFEKACENGEVKRVRGGRLVRDVPLGPIRVFLMKYKIHEEHRELASSRLLEFIDSDMAKRDVMSSWNVAVVEPKRGKPSEKYLGPLGHISMVRRARLAGWPEEKGADIKALMSLRDIWVDCPGVRAEGNWAALKKQRREVLKEDKPLLLIYVIDRNSGTNSKSRLPLEAVADMVGIGIVFPGQNDNRSYVRVILPQEKLEEEGENFEEELAALAKEDSV